MLLTTIRLPFLPQVLDRRPSVPRLPLGRLLSGDQGTQLPPVAVAADEAAITVAEAQPLQSRPTVPRLALSKLNPLATGASGVSSQAAAGGGSGRGGSGSGRWRPTAQASRIPAANFSTLDATAQRSPTKVPSGECGAGGAVLVQKAELDTWCSVRAELSGCTQSANSSCCNACPATGAVSADPLDDLDAMLDSATPQRQQSAREALASGEPLAADDRACWCRGGESWWQGFT